MHLSMYYSMYQVECICQCTISCIRWNVCQCIIPCIMWNAFVHVLFHVSPWPPDGPAEEGYTAMCYSMYHRDPLTVQLRKAIQQCAIPCITVTPWRSSRGRLYSNNNNQCEAFSWKQHLAEEMHQHGDMNVLSCLYLLAHWVWVVQVDFQKLLLLSMVAIHGSATEFHAKLQSMLMTVWMKPWNLPREAWF